MTIMLDEMGLCCQAGPGRGVTNWMSEHNLVSLKMPRSAPARTEPALIIDQRLSYARTSQSLSKKSPTIMQTLYSEI